jgi:hypothetical protein
LQGVGASKAETRERADRLVPDRTVMVQNFLKLDLSGCALLRLQIGFAT